MAKSDTKNTVKAEANLSKAQQQLVDASKPYVNKYINKTSPKGVKLPEEPLVAGFNQYQTAGQDQALAAVPAINQIGTTGGNFSNAVLGADPTQAGRSMVETWQNPAQGATNFLLEKVLYPESNPALQGAIDAATRPITESLVNEALPAVRSGAYTTGNFGSSRQGIAEGLASGEASESIGDAAANVANQGYQSGLNAMTSAYGNLLNASTSAYGTKQGALSDLYSTNLNAQLNALGLLPQTQSAQLTGALTTSGVGDVQQAQTQKEIDEQVYRELYKQLAPLQSAESLIALSGATPGGGSTTSTTMPGQDPLTTILGGATLGASLLPMFGQPAATTMY